MFQFRLVIRLGHRLSVHRSANADFLATMDSTSKNWRVRYGRALMPLILLIDNDALVRRLIRSNLTAAGYRWKEACTGHEALQLARECDPNLIIIDLDLPDVDGHAMVRQLREQLFVPIIVISEREGEFDRVEASDNGADDYLQKPFFTAELLARIRAALRHAEAEPLKGGPGIYDCGDFKIDLLNHALTVNGTAVYLSSIEFKLLKILVQHGGDTLTPDYLLTEIWGPQQVNKTRKLYAYIARLRRKIEADPIRPRYLLTDSAGGYKLLGAESEHQGKHERQS